MRRIIALTQNELLKLSKKASILVILILMLPAIFGIGGFFKLAGFLEEHDVFDTDDYYTSDEYYEEELKNYEERKLSAETSIESLTRQIADIENKLAENPTEQLNTQYENLQSELNYQKDELENVRREKRIFELCIKAGVPQNSISYLCSAASTIAGLEIAVENYAASPQLSAEEKALFEKTKSTLAAYTEIFEQKSYKKYIDWQKQEINASDMKAEEKQIECEILDITYKYDPEGINVSYAFEERINCIRTYKQSLLNNTNYSTYLQTPLSPAQREEILNKLAVAERQLERGIIAPSDSQNDLFGSSYSGLAISSMISVGMTLVLVLIVIVAGGSISQEISTGSIKSLIISPVKRWKIYTAKLISILILGVLGTLVTAALTDVAAMLFFGIKAVDPYIYAVNHIAKELSPFVYVLARCGVELIPIIVYGAFAFMLSVTTRNTAASVSIPIAIYFVGESAFNLITIFVSGEWLNFIPFMNLKLSGVIFPYADDAALISEIFVNTAPSLTFSLCYIAVLLICMLYTAFDSFTRRDI